ncbi:MAG: hypothetical protein EPO30_11010 [Lysobacteraceae bacterium]|nr:MAG: hypothetical protein EPO30_11010 [Xanthomonadaceae bacterium]
MTVETLVAVPTATLAIGDWVLIGTTLVLAAVALFVPYLAEVLKRSYFSPRLAIDFELNPPDCHLTREKGHDRLGQALDEPVFYFRFRVTNNGKSQARRCEALIEGMAVEDAGGRFQPLQRFTPVNLIWGSGYSTEFVDINPNRRFYCDLCHISTARIQALKLADEVYVNPSESPPFDVGIVINSKTAFYSQPNRLPSGRYLLSAAIYSENSVTVRKQFKISWSGVWRDTEEAMFREAVIELLRA